MQMFAFMCIVKTLVTNIITNKRSGEENNREKEMMENVEKR